MDKDILLISVFLTIVIYSAGIFSGIIATEYVESNADYTKQTISKTFDQREIVNNQTTVRERNITVNNTYYYDNLNFQKFNKKINYTLDNSVLKIKGVDFCDRLFGRSMQPAMWDGNTICFEKYEDQELSQGDIIKYEKNGNNLIHVITGEYEKWGYYLARGYSTQEYDKVEASDIKGVALATFYSDR